MKILVTVFILWLMPFVITSLFNHPAIDDYWNANAVNMYGKIGAVRYFYNTVSGRYSSLFIMSFCNTLPEGKIWIFKIWPIVVITFLLISSYFFYSSFITQPYSKSDALLLSCLFVVCHIAGMRSLFEGLYWMSSTVCYQLAIGVFAIGIGAIVRDVRMPKLTTRIIAITSCLLLPGTVEMVIPIYFFTLLLLLYFSYKLHYTKSTIIYCLIITLILVLVVMLSKGNIVRVENNSLLYHKSIWMALWYCSKSVAYYTAIYTINPLFISAILIVGLLYHFKNTKLLSLSKTDFRIVIGCFTLSGLAVYLPLHLVESDIPYPRITSLFFFVFFHACLLITFFNSVAIFNLLNKVKMTLNIRNVKTVLLIVLVFSAFTTKNFVLVCKDLFNGISMKYDIENYQRYALLKFCKVDTCFVPPHKYWPYFAQSSKNETSDPNHFQHMNVYFKKTILFK